MNTNGKKVAYLGLLAALAILFGYIETLIPFHFGIPGIKLGLANIVTVLALYLFGMREASAVMLIRVLTVGFMFGNPYSMIYGMAGGILSLIFMCFFKRCKNFSIVGVSIAGGIFHNIGQLAVAAFVVKELRIAYYAPLLIIAGTIAGFLIGIVSGILYKRLSGLKNF